MPFKKKILKVKNENTEFQTIPQDELNPLLDQLPFDSSKERLRGKSSIQQKINGLDIIRKLNTHQYGNSISGSATHQDEAFIQTRESLMTKQKVL